MSQMRPLAGCMLYKTHCLVYFGMCLLDALRVQARCPSLTAQAMVPVTFRSAYLNIPDVPDAAWAAWHMQATAAPHAGQTELHHCEYCLPCPLMKHLWPSSSAHPLLAQLPTCWLLTCPAAHSSRDM